MFENLKYPDLHSQTQMEFIRANLQNYSRDKEVFAMKIYHDSKDNIKKRKIEHDSPNSPNLKPSNNYIEEFKLDEDSISSAPKLDKIPQVQESLILPHSYPK